MENVSRALIMAFSMLMFVIGFSYSMYLLNKLVTTSDSLIESVATTSYYDNIEVKDSEIGCRTVGIDTIIPTLYRYYKENYIVMIYDGSELLQRFDIDLETQIARAASINPTTMQGDTPEKKRMISLYNSIYNKKEEIGKRNKAYLFEAPWTGNVEKDTRARIDYFLNGTKGYINNTEIDYKIFGSGNQSFVDAYKDAKFTEKFVEYAYKGETISTDEGVETITGSTQESSKIIITYTKK